MPTKQSSSRYNTKEGNQGLWVAETDGFGHTTITARDISSAVIVVRGGRDVYEHAHIASLIVQILNTEVHAVASPRGKWR